ncbi:MAG TPA: hypothetical protein VNT03_08735 [Baekduia sp.]|nr:hypothetical protein [Baekduia sp.]
MSETATQPSGGTSGRPPTTRLAIVWIPGLGTRAETSVGAIARNLATACNAQDVSQAAYEVVDATNATALGTTGLQVARSRIRRTPPGGSEPADLADIWGLPTGSVMGKDTVDAGLVRKLGLILHALWVVLRRTRGGDKDSLTPKQRRQLRYTHAYMVIGALAALLLAAALAASGIAALSGADAVLGVSLEAFGFTSVGVTAITGALAYAKRAAISASSVMGGAVRYLENDARKPELLGALTQTLDAMADQEQYTHVLVAGYSFGSIVALDGICPEVSLGAQRGYDVLCGLVTIGCPFDYVRRYWPDYFDGRHPRKGELPWINVCRPGDVFASNFRDDDESVAADPQIGIGRDGAADGPARPINVYYPDDQPARLSFGEAVALKGLKVHGGYWSADSGGADAFVFVAALLGGQGLVPVDAQGG